MKSPAPRPAPGEIRSDALYTLPEVRRRLGWGNRSWWAARDGGLPAIAFRGKLYVRGADVLAFFGRLERERLAADSVVVNVPPQKSRDAAGKVREVFDEQAKERQVEHGGTAPGKNTSGKRTGSDARDAAGKALAAPVPAAGDGDQGGQGDGGPTP